DSEGCGWNGGCLLPVGKGSPCAAAPPGSPCPQRALAHSWRFGSPAQRRGRTFPRESARCRHTFYVFGTRKPPLFSEFGAPVKKGQVLCIIEAMKLMNEIDSEYEGQVVNIYVENGQPVQYGERLFAIRTL